MENQQSENEDNSFVTIFKTSNQIKLAHVKSILDSANILYCVKNEMVQTLFGMGNIGGVNQITGPVEVQVETDNVETSQELLSELIEK